METTPCSVPDKDRSPPPGLVLELCGRGGQSCVLVRMLEEEEEGTLGRGGVARRWDVRPGMDDSVTGRGERGRAHPRATGPPVPPKPQLPPQTPTPPPHQTCRIMLIYGDGWQHFQRSQARVHQRIYLLARLKGAKASAKQRPTLRVRPGPERRD